jgi:hypothetical protein
MLTGKANTLQGKSEEKTLRSPLQGWSMYRKVVRHSKIIRAPSGLALIHMQGRVSIQGGLPSINDGVRIRP